MKTQFKVCLALGTLAGITGGGLYYLYHLILVRKKENNFPFRRKKAAEALEVFNQNSERAGAWLLKMQENVGNVELLEITSFDGLKLIARYVKNENSQNTIIFMHGYRSSVEHDFAKAMCYFYKQGYNLLLVDERSHGRSEGTYIGYGVLERYDLRDWMNYLNKKYPQTKNLYAYGVSMGASTVMMATGLELPSNVRAMIADCGFTSPWNIFVKIKTQDMRMPEGVMLQMFDRMCKKRAGYGFKNVSTVDCMRKNQIPMIFIHGTGDTFVPWQMTMENYLACKADKRLILVENAVHGAAYITNEKQCQEGILPFLKHYEK